MGKERQKPEKFDEYSSYRGLRANWAMLSKAEKNNLVSRALTANGASALKCLNLDCSEMINEFEDIVSHVDSCWEYPEYFTYMGKVELFRALDRNEKKRLIREAVCELKYLPCLNRDAKNCQKASNNRFGLLYHVERCGILLKDRPPWKCYRCGTLITYSICKDHFDKCRGVKREETSELTNEVPNEETTYQVSRKVVRSKCGASLAKGYMPDNSRTSIVAGMKRYRFRCSSITTAPPTTREQHNYFTAAEAACTSFDHTQAAVPLCSAMRELKYNAALWTTVNISDCSETLKSMLGKKSVGICLPKAGDEMLDLSKISDTGLGEGRAERLSTFETRSMHYERTMLKGTIIRDTTEVQGEAQVAYCGGPISTIAVCPRQLNDGRECVTVSVFPDEEYLLSKTQDESRDYLQFWIFNKFNTEVTASLWFILEVCTTTVLATVWCHALRAMNAASSALFEFLGALAVAGSEGDVQIFGIHSELLSLSNDGITVYRAIPNLVLYSPECCANAPIISVAWCEYNGGAQFAGISAAGPIMIWDLNAVDSPARIIFSSDWMSWPLSIAFCESNRFTVAFREKMLRTFDIDSLECLTEESAVRTAGVKVLSYERVFPGVFSFQTDYSPSQDHLLTGASYITLDAAKTNTFVLPLANRHEVQMWDLGICPRTGSILSVGGDGRLQISMNGRIAARGAEVDYSFTLWRVLMTLFRRTKSRNNVISEQESLDTADLTTNTAPELPYTDLESCAEKSYLEVSYQDVKMFEDPLPLYSLNIRTESLNKLAVSEGDSQLVICGGEAGLLFFMPYEL